MITSHRYRGGVRAGVVPPEEIERELADGATGGWLWIDARDPSADELALLERALGLHPLAVEDARHRGQRPKVEVFEGHAFVVLRPVNLTEAGDLRDEELHLFVAERYLAAIGFGPSVDLAPAVARWSRIGGVDDGTAGALYAILDEVADGYLSVVEELEDAVDDLEDFVFEVVGDVDERGVQGRLVTLRRDAVRLRRFAAPTRQVLDRLIEDGIEVGERLVPYYRDVTDHLLRSVELADNVREVLTTIQEVRTAQAANQLNEAMKRLTAWAGIILVPTLIAGIYGMNFDRMPELHWAVGYPLALAMMGLSAAALYVVFRRRGWL